MEELSQEQFRIIGIEDNGTEHSARKKVGYWQDAWRRLRANKIAMAALVLLILLLLMTIIGPHLTGYSYEEMDKASKNLPPSAAHWFGTDELGRDLFTRVWQGGRVSMIIGLFSAAVSTLIGVLYGSISAFFGGIVDNIMMRIVEIIMSIQ